MSNSKVLAIIKPKMAFAAVYTVLLGKKSGPKAGPFVAGMTPEFVRERFASAATAGGPVMRDTEGSGGAG